MAVMFTSLFLLALCISARIASASIDNENEINDENTKLYSSRKLLGKMSRMIGYPRLSNHQETDHLFSEDEMQQIISHEISDEEMKAMDDRDPCAHDLVRVVLSLRENWAISMLDADGKVPAGLTLGNLAWPGSYSECLAIQAPPDPIDHQKGFGGRYCTLSMSVGPANMMINLGVCVPDTCQDTDFANITKFQLFLKNRAGIWPKLSWSSNSSTHLISLIQMSCQPKDSEYDTGAIVVLVILYTCLFLVIIGTSLTVIESIVPPPSQERVDSINALSAEINFEEATKNSNHENSELVANGSDLEHLVPKTKSSSVIEYIAEFLKCFCLIKNGSKILDTSDKGGTELRCIHGIRFLSMAWVILGHTYAFAVSGAVIGNLYDLLKLLNTFFFQMILQGTYAVDSFFVMSGFLLTHLFLREMNARDGKISWLAFYIHRYVRLTPVYAILIAFETKLTWYLISGPFRPSAFETGCTKSWWWNLLYINNFQPMEESCMAWSWYLANDMQFYVISPLFLYALWRWPKIGLGIVSGLFCGSWISNFSISYHYNIIAGFSSLPNLTNMLTFLQGMNVYMEKLYIKPYTRIGPYLIGVLLAYALSQTKGRKNFLTIVSQTIGWTASTVMGLYMVFGMFHAEPTRVENAFYNAFNRCCFSASLAWVIFACLTGHGGAVNKILSHSIFIPLSRLTYCAYLVHPIVMMVYLFSLPSTMIITHFQMVMQYLGMLVLAYMVAFGTSLLLESPTMAIEKLLRFGIASKRKEEIARTN